MNRRLAPLPSPDDWTEEEDRLGFFGPGSVTWRIHGDPAYHLGAMRALMLQALHPVAMDGVARNSAGFKDDWWMRITRTGQYMETAVFGTRTEARRMAARVRGYHRKLSGVEETTGRAYRVDDPDLLLWVHSCAVESILTTARRAGLDLPDRDADRYVAEQVAFAQLVGVPLETVPTSVAELDAYFAGIRPELRATPAAVKGVRDLFLPPMPGWLQVLTPARPVWGSLAGLCFALLPGWARRMYSLPGLPLTDAAATTGLRAFRAGFLALPDRAYRSPIVRAGFERAGAERLSA
ncbi:oxygenase MpaB family protein [Blastococcus sp. TF02A-30]|uniref:oxygenase MpaB family protein n=1 Tax=Blastococcus sp. TF02A-30 TaxID=2250580 RepID=UPI001F46FE34|nr:oxygenase MpaB family protein [Blastococcus sp. TF02A-30]